jgi:hypothetical protein
MARHHFVWLALALCAATPAIAGCSKSTSHSAGSNAPLPALPAEADRWVNGAPLALAAKGDVVLVEAWHRQ